LVKNGISLSFKQKLCRNNYCDFLSKEINILIKDASKKLLSLHKNEFDFVPLIGWDIILSKKNYFVLEGNITPDISFKKNEYIKIIKKYYNY
jgi:DNA replication protein DnaD